VSVIVARANGNERRKEETAMRLFYPCASLEYAKLIATRAVPLTALACSDCDSTRLYRHARRAAVENQKKAAAVVRFKLDEVDFWKEQNTAPDRIFDCSEDGEVWHLRPSALKVLHAAEAVAIELTQLDKELKPPKRSKASRRPIR
jgi:hypothetical protein